jgi:hypothetical protein
MNQMKCILPALALCAGALAAGPTARAGDSPFAAEVVAHSADLDASGLYNDPNAVLGKPTTLFYDPWMTPPRNERVKLVEGAYNVSPQSEKLLTTIDDGSFLVVKFDHPVEDDPNNPFGLDFLIFGNQTYQGVGNVNDSTDMNTYMLAGLSGGADRNNKVSVSCGYQELAGQVENDPDTWRWFTYDSGSCADDTAFPTQAYQWDATAAAWTDTEMDWTKPVDPQWADDLLNGGISAAAAIALYDGSAGGTGFDIGGFDLPTNAAGNKWIQYIRVEDDVVGDYSDGPEIDGFADVAPVPEPATMSLLALGGLAMLRRRRNPVRP